MKNCFLAQNFTKIGQLAGQLWLKTIFNMAAVRHLEFKKNHFGHVTVIEFQIFSYVPNCIKIG